MRGIFSARACAAAAALAAATIAVLPGTADAAVAGAFQYPLVTVHLAAKTVTAPGQLEAALHTSVCVGQVSAYAVNLPTGQVVVSSTDDGRGELARVTFTVPAGARPGTYELAGVYGRPCGGTGGVEQLNPARGHFAAAFTVTGGR